jgi:antitoxin component of MazEF toxin-antitoxin module
VIKTLTKHGNSYAMVIDKPILDLIQATAETPFEIISDGRSLVLTPVREPAEEKKFEDAVAMIHKRFGSAMKKAGDFAILLG